MIAVQVTTYRHYTAEISPKSYLNYVFYTSGKYGKTAKSLKYFFIYLACTIMYEFMN